MSRIANPRHRAILAALWELTGQDGPPSTEALRTRLGVRSRTTVWEALKRLEALGMVEQRPDGRYWLRAALEPGR